MFTGIIEGLGRLKAIEPAGEGKKLTIDADFVLGGSRVGDSIAVSGACLTAVMISDRRFIVDVSPETLARSTLGRAKTGERVNIERALRLSDRLDGHLVSGHIDGVGTMAHKETKSNAIVIHIDAPESLCRYIIEKGSVAVDGISLTINECSRNSFVVSIIPLTAKMTTISFKNIGDLVNIETDMIGKYVEKFLSGGQQERKESVKSNISMDFLARAGFLNTQY
ncbi:MAG: riboflavin synthase [Desulfobacterales bacterium]